MEKLDKKYHLIKTAKFPLIFIVIIWAVKLLEASLESNFVEYGVLPRKLSGLKGILFSPFIHKDIKHLLNNSLPILNLGSTLSLYYKKNYKINLQLHFFK